MRFSIYFVTHAHRDTLSGKRSSELASKQADERLGGRAFIRANEKLI